MSVKWMKQTEASGAKRGWDMRVLHEIDYDPPRYTDHDMKVD